MSPTSPSPGRAHGKAAPKSRPQSSAKAHGKRDETRIVEAEFVGAQGIGSGQSLPPPTFAEVAFAGRSNVGKSSLINTLVERKGLVRTSSTPGCTRQINLFKVRASDGVCLSLADLPGYGFARRSKTERKAWGDLIEGYLQTRPTLGAVVLLIDLRRGVEPDDRELIDFIERAAPAVDRRPVQLILVATKADKAPRSQQRALLGRLGSAENRKVIGFSSVTREGRDELWKAIRNATVAASR
jgi:GTP-binding protein